MIKGNRTRWIFWYAALLHLGWGIALLLSDKPIHSVGVSPYMDWLPFQVWGGVFVFISVFAIVEILYGLRYGVILIWLQMGILTISALTATVCIIKGQYADNAVYPRLFIFTDQLPSVIAWLLHVCALIQAYGIKRQ